MPLEEILDRLELDPRWYTVYCTEQGLTHNQDPFSRSKCRLENDEECFGHSVYLNRTIHNFDGWYLAWYIQKWYEQGDKVPVLKQTGHKYTEKMLQDKIDGKDPFYSIKQKVKKLEKLVLSKI